MQPSDLDTTHTETAAPSPASINSGSNWSATPFVGPLIVWTALSGGEAVIAATTKLILAMAVYAVAKAVCDVLAGRPGAADRLRRMLTGGWALCRRRVSRRSHTASEARSQSDR